MKKLFIIAFLCGVSSLVSAQQPAPPISTTQITQPLFAVNMQPVSQASVSLVGNPGPQTYYYWLTANYTVGSTAPTGPFVAVNVPNTLSVSNYVRVTPVYPAGAASVTLLRTTSPIQPSGACNCAVATNVTSGTINDQSNSLNSYTVTPFDPNTLNITLTNEVVGSGQSHELLRQNGVLVCDLSTGCGSAGGVTSFTGDGALLNNVGSTGAVIATLGNAPAHTVWGNNTSSSGIPSYVSSTSLTSGGFALPTAGSPAPSGTVDTSTCNPSDVNPSVYVQLVTGHWLPIGGSDTNASIFQPGTFELCNHLIINDTMNEPPAGQNALLTVNHTTGVGTFNPTNDDRAATIINHMSSSETGTFLNVYGAYAEMNPAGSPTFNGNTISAWRGSGLDTLQNNSGAAVNFSAITGLITRSNLSLNSMLSYNGAYVQVNDSTSGSASTSPFYGYHAVVNGATTSGDVAAFYAAPGTRTVSGTNEGLHLGAWGASDYSIWSEGSSTTGKVKHDGPMYMGQRLTGIEVVAPAGVVSSDILWADSTAHRWNMNNNNAGAVALVGTSTTPATSGHVAVYASNGYNVSDGGASPYTGGLVFNVQTYGAAGNTKTVSDAVTNGTTTLTSATAAFVSGDTGKSIICVACGASGANLKTTITFVNSTTVTLGAAATSSTSGQTIWWGTDDSTAIAAAQTAANSAGGGTVFFPVPGTNTCYLMNTKLQQTSATGHVTYAGAGYGSCVVGDPGNAALFEIGASPYIDVYGLRLANLHSNPTAGSDAGWFTLHCQPCSHSHFYGNYFTAGRGGIYMDSVTQWVEIGPGNEFDGLTDIPIAADGDASHLNSFIQVHDNRIMGTLFPAINGQPHDINLEDTSDVIVSHNYIQDSNTVSGAGASCITVGPDGYSAVARITIMGNICDSTNPQSILHGVTLAGGAGGTSTISDYLIQGNSFTGYGEGVGVSGITLADQLNNFQVKGNTFNNCGLNSSGCIYFTANPTAVQRLFIEGNTVVGSGATAGGGPCINLSRVTQIMVNDNQLSNCGTVGIYLSAVQSSTISHNMIYDVSKNSSNTWYGIVLATATATPDNNLLSDNNVFDDQGASNTVKYNIFVNAGTGNRILNNRVSNAKTFNYRDEGTGTIFSGPVGKDVQNATINSLGATTLVPTLFNATDTPMTMLITIASECTAVATSTLQWQVNYTGLNGAINQQGASHACTTAGQFTDTFLIRSTGATAVTYQAVVANAPAFRDTAVAQLQ